MKGQMKHQSIKFVEHILIVAVLVLGTLTVSFAADSEDDAASTQKLESMTVVAKTLQQGMLQGFIQIVDVPSEPRSLLPFKERLLCRFLK